MRDATERRDEAYASLGIGGGLQGAARYALLNIPEPVAAADTDFNRGITLEEFRQAARRPLPAARQRGAGPADPRPARGAAARAIDGSSRRKRDDERGRRPRRNPASAGDH